MADDTENPNPIDVRLRNAIAAIGDARSQIWSLGNTPSNVVLEAALSAHKRFDTEHNPLTGEDGVDGRIEDVDGDVEAIHAASDLLNMYRRAVLVALGRKE